MGDFLFVFLVVGGLGSFFYYKSRDSVSHSSAEEVAAEEIVAEEIVAEEIVAEEIVAEEVAAEEIVAEEIVAEEVVAEEVVAEEVVAEEVVAEEVVAEEVVAEEVVAEEPEHNALTWRVLQRVLENPGILQVELYKLFPHENRKQLQSTLLQLDKENVLKRENSSLV